MGYGLPESYGLSPLSQLRTGQKVWGIGSYGLSEGMGYGEFDCSEQDLPYCAAMGA